MSTLKTNAVTAQTTNSALTLTGNGSGLVTIGDGALTFPDADGSASQVIQTNGSGALSFATPAAGGGRILIGTDVAAGDASLDVTGLNSTYDAFEIEFSDITVGTDSVVQWLRVGDSGGIDTGSSDYMWTVEQINQNGTAAAAASAGDSKMVLSNAGNIGSATGEGWGGNFRLHRPGDGATVPMITGQSISKDDGGNIHSYVNAGFRNAVITLDRVQLLASSGTISGRMTIWGLKHG